MKNVIYILLLLTCLLSSCDIIELIDGCKDPKAVELTDNDKIWMPDSIQYFVKENDTFRIETLFTKPIYSESAVIDCKKPVLYKSSPITEKISKKNLVLYTNINKSSRETNISYEFFKGIPNNLVVGVNQVMGMIDLETQNVIPLDNIDYVHGEYLGNHTIRGREYTEVYKFTDLNENNTPEIDVASIIVSPIGFLRIEFYDGEVWERIIIE